MFASQQAVVPHRGGTSLQHTLTKNLQDIRDAGPTPFTGEELACNPTYQNTPQDARDAGHTPLTGEELA
jgi:hypothetical protein